MDAPAFNLAFELDGTLSAAVLDTLPADLRARVTTPEFIEQARAAIKAQRRTEGGLERTGRRESRLKPIGIHRFPGEGSLNRKARRRLAAASR